jgi:hypothetical protein
MHECPRILKRLKVRYQFYKVFQCLVSDQLGVRVVRRRPISCQGVTVLPPPPPPRPHPSTPVITADQGGTQHNCMQTSHHLQTIVL